MNADALAALRDVHLPPDLAWWPPAPGHILLALLGAALLVAMAWRHFRQRRAGSLRVRVRAELKRVQQRFERHGDERQLLAELSELLRRAALACHGRSVAGLSGPAWAAHLAQTAPPGGDAQIWELVAIGRYRRDLRIPDAARLFGQCRLWLEHVAS